MSIVAAVMPAPRVPVELREFSEPALEPGSVLLQTLYSEVCGTHVHIWHGRLAGVPYPIIPGHVSVGVASKTCGDVRSVDGGLRALRVLEGHHRTVPWRRIGAQTYPLAAINLALADAEAMRIPKALVQPN